MIKFVETLKTGDEHLIVNAKIIEMFNIVFKEKIEVYSEKNHGDKLKSYNDIIKYKHIKVIGHGKGKIRSILHFFLSILYNFLFLLCSTKKDKIIYLSVNPVGLLVIKILNFLLRREVYMVCHSELEFLIEENDKYLGSIYKKIARIYRFSFNKIKKDNIKYIVLGESIKRNLLKFYEKLDENRIIAIDIPYEYSSLLKDISLSKNMKFGCIGIGSLSKGTDNIFRVAECFKEKIKNEEVTFSIIGKITEDVKQLANCYVNFLPDTQMLDREEYESKVQELDYILYFYPKDSYKLIASGAFFDAIAYEKPILAIENDFFKYYFEKLGNIGYLCSDNEEMVKKIDFILSHREKYNIQKNNLKISKEKLAIEKIAKNFRKQI